MSYLITQPNGQIVIQLPDGTADGPDINPGLNASDVNLIGHNYTNYGRILNENFIKLLQNFANNVPPLKPLVGELWYDTLTGFLKVYDGTKYLAVSPLIIDSVQPVASFVGVEWWDTTNEQLKVYNGTDWTTIGPAFSKLDGISGAIVDHVLDTNSVSHTVVKMYTHGNIVSILSYDSPAFTPMESIPGFALINPGITLSTLNNNNVMYGTATNAQQLGNIAAVNYARNDITSTFQANIAIGNGNFTLNSDAVGHTSLINPVLGANVTIFNNVNGVSTRTLHVSGTDGRVTVAQNPNTPMGVATKSYTDSSIASATAPLATSISPNLSGDATYTASIPHSDSSTLLATTGWVQSAITYGNTGPWQGSHQFVSTVTPSPIDGDIGDFWFQI